MCKPHVLTKVKAMNTSTPSFAQCLADESGVTAIEYGLLAALIAVTIIGSVSATGASISEMYGKWTSAVIAAIAGAG
jgi:pilus assembly protein Flp/PilA